MENIGFNHSSTFLDYDSWGTVKYAIPDAVSSEAFLFSIQ